MDVARLINVLVTFMLIQMMIVVGLSVTLAEVLAAARNGRRVVLALLANYFIVPAITIALLAVVHPLPVVAAGFLILAVCPGAPFGPPFVAIARGNVPLAVGLMVLLAGSSAIAAPLLLYFLLPLVSGDQHLIIDSTKLISTLLVTQLVPLCVGVALREWRPALAARLLKPANLASKILNILTIGLIVVTQVSKMTQIRVIGFEAMLFLLATSLLAGFLMGGPERGDRKTVALTTSLRNVGVSLVIASGNFAGTPALTAVLAYAVVELLGSLLVAMWWGRKRTSV